MVKLDRPLQLEPVFKAKLWGRQDLAPLYDRARIEVVPDASTRALSSKDAPVGEAWLTEDTSKFSLGPLAGTTLAGAVAKYGPELVGKNWQRSRFPLLAKHIFTNDWLSVQRAAAKAEAPGAQPRVVSALELQEKLKLILEGEPPYDIYVRWKPLSEQPIGWNPDLNDGVRLNIRPFVTAGALRSKFTINWTKDRGKNPDGSERINDRHCTTAEKRAARHAVSR